MIKTPYGYQRLLYGRDQQDHKILQLCFGRLQRKKTLKIHDALNETRIHANELFIGAVSTWRPTQHLLTRKNTQCVMGKHIIIHARLRQETQ